jgi:hypothetical protein
MPKRSSKPPRREDPIQAARRVVDEATGERPKTHPPEKNPAAVALGRLGGVKGGPARAAKLSAKRRAEIAQNAAVARWRKDREK